jgi:hypothetical protein
MGYKSMSGAGGSLMPVMMGMSATSAATTAYAQSQAFKAQGNYESTVANTNEAMANLTKDQTLEQGDIAAGNKNLETRQRVGAIRASQGGSGVNVGSGSSLAVQTGANLVGTLDEMTIRNNAQRRAFGYKVQATQDSYQGRFARMTAASESMQTLLSGGMKAVAGPLGIYANYQRWTRYLGGGVSGSVSDNYINAGTG